MQKLQSGMAGEIMPLRSLGYALDEATLKQVALNHGITENITNLSQAQKAQLRYIAIMEQSKNAMGDMARTIDSPANQLRILESRIQTLKRAIGDSLMPVISAALPYVTAFVQILGETFRSIAEFMGFELPVFDYSDLTKGTDSITEGFEEATAASNKFKGTLAGIDQLNIIGSKSETSGAGDLFSDLNLDLPSYDFLGNLQEETSKAYDTLKKFLADIAPLVTGIATTLGALFIGDKVVKGLKAIADGFKFLTQTPLGKVAATITATVTAFLGFKKIVKDLTTGNGNLNKLALAIGAVSVAIGVMAATGNPIGALVTLFGAATGAIVGWVEGQKELDRELANLITYANNGGISIRGLTDGFKGYFDSITSHYNDILNNTKAFEDNESKIQSAAKEIKNLTDKYIALGDEMTTEDANQIKSNLEIIADGVTESLGIGTQGIVDALKGKFHDFAISLGADVDEMVGKFYLLESMGNEAIASIKKNADALVGKIMSGEDVSENMRKLNEEIAKMGVTDIGTKEQFTFNEALKNMTSKQIQFNSPEELKNALEDITSQANAAKASIEEAKTSQLMELETLKSRYSQIVTDSGLTVKEAFDKAMGEGAFDTLFEQTRETLISGFEFDKAKIDTGVATYMAMVEAQLNKNADKYAQSKFSEKGPGFGSTAKNFFLHGGLFASGEDLYYQALSDYADEYKKINSEFYTVISNATKGIDVSSASEIGKYLMEGMAKGVFDNQDLWYAALDAATRGAIDEVKEICGIASPSKVFAEIGGFLMKGLAVGIDKNETSVLSALDDTAYAMQRQMSGIEFDLPVYTEEDIERSLSKVLNPNITFAPNGNAPRYEGADPQQVTDVSRIWSSNGQPMDVNVNVQSYVELDGEQVGYATAQYQQRQMAYSNGR